MNAFLKFLGPSISIENCLVMLSSVNLAAFNILLSYFIVHTTFLNKLNMYRKTRNWLHFTGATYCWVFGNQMLQISLNHTLVSLDWTCFFILLIGEAICFSWTLLIFKISTFPHVSEFAGFDYWHLERNTKGLATPLCRFMILFCFDWLGPWPVKLSLSLSPPPRPLLLFSLLFFPSIFYFAFATMCMNTTLPTSTWFESQISNLSCMNIYLQKNGKQTVSPKLSFVAVNLPITEPDPYARVLPNSSRF